MIKYFLKYFLLLYLIIGGFLFYLLDIYTDIVFRPYLKMSIGWCEEYREYMDVDGPHKDCIKFKNRVEELKALHNEHMFHRRKIIVAVLFGFASISTYLLMLLAPNRFFDSNKVFLRDKIAAALFYGSLLSIVLPLFYSAIFPQSLIWVPNELLYIRRAITDSVLEDIIRQANHLPF